MNRLGRLLHIIGAVWIIAGLALILFSFAARGWMDVDALTAGWPVDFAAVSRFEANLARFLLILPGFLLAFTGYRLRKRSRRGRSS
ncbi:MAG TPA: hypothetical protein VF699_02335 [Caulobacteraceae bacterium]|jgi:hypothetical protein